MHGTETTDKTEDAPARQALTGVTSETFSELELKNQLFRRIAWAAALLFLVVITVLILELTGVIPY